MVEEHTKARNTKDAPLRPFVPFTLSNFRVSATSAKFSALSRTEDLVEKPILVQTGLPIDDAV